jgi:hypothetical protein
MKINIINIVLLFSIIILASCTKEEIPLYDSEDYIYFKMDNESEYIQAFSLCPGKESVEVPVVIELIGNISDKDRKIAYSIVTEETTAAPENYDLPETFTFAKGKNIDTIYVKLNNTAALKNEIKTLALKLENSDDLLVGLPTNSVLHLKMHDKLAKPNWWNETIVNEFLGDYSDKKFQLFIEVTGVADLANKDEDFIRNYVLKFKYYLQQQRDAGNEVLEEDGAPMTVTIIG